MKMTSEAWTKTNLGVIDAGGNTGKGGWPAHMSLLHRFAFAASLYRQECGVSVEEE